MTSPGRTLTTDLPPPRKQGHLSRDDTVEWIHKILHRLKEDGFEPHSNVYTDENGRVDVAIYDLTTVDPKVEFVVHRGDEPPQSFTTIQVALVYLFRQTPHIQRKK